MKPAEPEAQCTRRVILPARVPTTLTYTQTMVGNARLRGKGCCFDSRGGSRLVRLMRQIEFIGSALDQQGLRSSIKKGIGMLWDWLNARRIVCGNGAEVLLKSAILRRKSDYWFRSDSKTSLLISHALHVQLSTQSLTYDSYLNNEDFDFISILCE